LTEVAERRLDEGQAPAVAVLLLGGFDGAKLQARDPSGLPDWRTGANQLVDVQLEMAGELRLEVAVAASAAREAKDSHDKRA
jgi:hypothetical protein